MIGWRAFVWGKPDPLRVVTSCALPMASLLNPMFGRFDIDPSPRDGVIKIGVC